MADVACPFCGISSPEALVIQAHIEEEHSEGVQASSQDTNLVQQLAGDRVENAPTAMLTGEWTKCTRRGCGEYIYLSDIDDHLEVHAAQSASEDDVDSSKKRSAAHRQQNLGRSADSLSLERQSKLQKSRPAPSKDGKGRSGTKILNYFAGTSYHGTYQGLYQGKPQRPHRQQARPPGRLGRRELGPHAFEIQMPEHVRRRLLNDAQPHYVQKLGRTGRLVRETVVDNETARLIPLLADVCAHDSSTESTYFCHPEVKHIAKLRCDGNFCGYWSIQVLLSYLQATKAMTDMDVLPDVLAIQDGIEQGWDNGICSYGKTETGGVRGSRKWIGTSEAVAYFTQIGVPVEAHAFEDDDDDDPKAQLAVVHLLDFIEAYFISGIETAKTQGTSHITQLAPVYFQRLGHSMTIVGLERKKDSSRNLLVFDSSFETSASMRTLLAGGRSRAEIETLLGPYRRSEQSLARWEEFEIVLSQSRTHA